MIKTPTKTTLTLLAAAALLTAAAVQAQPPRGARPGPGGPPPPGSGMGPGFGLLRGPVADRLDLSDEQRDQIAAILEAQRQASEPWHEDMKTLGAELESATEAEPFDEEAVRAVARQLADVRVELAVARARTAQEVRAVLTPDQRETLGEMRSQRGRHGESFRGSGRRGFERRGPGG